MFEMRFICSSLNNEYMVDIKISKLGFQFFKEWLLVDIVYSRTIGKLLGFNFSTISDFITSKI